MKLIKTHNPEIGVDNLENIFEIVFNAIFKLNVNMARIFKQMYVTFDNDLEKEWKDMLVIAADEYAAKHNGDQSILIVNKSAGSSHQVHSNDNSKETASLQKNRGRQRQRQHESNEKGNENKSNESNKDSQKKKQRPKCTHCGKSHKSAECWTLEANADKRPIKRKSNESPKGRDVKVASDNPKDFKKKKFRNSKFKGKKRIGKATSLKVNTEDEVDQDSQSRNWCR